MPKFYDLLDNETLDMELDYHEENVLHNNVYIGFPEFDEDDPDNTDDYISIIVNNEQIFPTFEEVDIIVQALEIAKIKRSRIIEKVKNHE